MKMPGQWEWDKTEILESDRPPPGADPGGGRSLSKTYESSFIHHDYVQFGKQPSRYKAILSSIVLWQQCYEVGYTGTSSLLQ